MKDKYKPIEFRQPSQGQEKLRIKNGNKVPSLHSYGELPDQSKAFHLCPSEDGKLSLPLLYSPPILETEPVKRVKINERVWEPLQQLCEKPLRNKENNLLGQSSLLNQEQQEISSTKMTGFSYAPIESSKFAEDNQVDRTPVNEEINNRSDDDEQVISASEKEESHPVLEEMLTIDTVRENEFKNLEKENEFETELLQPEESYDGISNTKLPESADNKLIGTERKVTVKLPVLLANIKPDIDIIRTLYLPFPIDCVSKVEWTLKSFDCIGAIPSTVIFMKGKLTASIEYKSEGMTYYHIETIPFERSESLKMTWLSPPCMPFKNQQEFMFSEYDEGATNSHHEYAQQYTDPITTQLQCVHFTSYETFYFGPQNTEMIIIGELTLSIAILQEQFMKIGVD